MSVFVEWLLPFLQLFPFFRQSDSDIEGKGLPRTQTEETEETEIMQDRVWQEIGDFRGPEISRPQPSIRIMVYEPHSPPLFAEIPLTCCAAGTLFS